MEKKLVSVIITTYGRSRELLYEAIESVRKQTYENIEIVIVDDNGMGSEIQRQNEYFFKKEKDIKYVANEKNSGAQVARNNGILNSQGEYIACLDDDDIWSYDKIEKQVCLMEAENLGLVFCNGYRFFDNDITNRKLYQVNFISDKYLDFQTELRGDHIGSTSIPLMRRECLALTGLFDIDMPARQDYEMWLRFCKYYKVKGIDEPLFFYRYHSGDRITKSYKKEILSYKLLLKKYHDDYKKDSTARANIYFTICRTHLKAKKILRGGIYGLRAFINSPKTVFEVIRKYKMKKALF